MKGAEAMRVLLLGTFLPASLGSPAVSEGLGERLAAGGWTVYLHSRKTGRVARLRDTVAVAWRLRSDYSVALVDVFSGRAFALAEAACWSLRRARKPYVLALHGGSLPAFARRWPRRVRRLLDSAALVTMPSGYLTAELGPLTAPVRVMPNPISLAHYPFEVRATPRSRLIWLRAFHRIYGAKLACEVLARLRSDHPEARLVMIGHDKRDGSLEEVRDFVETAGLTDHVRLVGPVAKSDVPRWLSGSDIFLNTASVDHAPVSVLEAQACGLCVVSTDAGGLRQALTHGHDGLLAPAGDPDALAAGVRRILAEPGLGEGLSRHARERAAAHDWDLWLPRWRDLFREAAGRA